MFLTARLGTPADDALVRRFYDRYPNTFVLTPSDTDRRAALDERRFLLCLEDQDLIGVTAINLLPGRLAEYRWTLVDEAVRGYNLQTWFYRVHTALVSTLQPSPQPIVGAHPHNHATRCSALKAGFIPWLPSRPELETLCAGCGTCTFPKLPATRPCCDDFFILPPENALASIQLLLTEMPDGRTHLMHRTKTTILEVMPDQDIWQLITMPT